MKKNFILLFHILLFTLFVLSGCEEVQTNTGGDQKETTTEVDQADRGENRLQSGDQTEEKGDDENNPNDRSLPKLTVHFIDVGQADATLFEFGSFTLLIDAGNWDSTDVVDYLSGQGISKLDIVVGTHPDADHIGQLDKIINQFEVGEVWLSGNTNTSETFQEVLIAIDSKNVDYDEPRAGDIYDIGPLKIDILNPETISGNSNEESISMKLTYGDVSFVFTGDAGTAAEQNMIQSGNNLNATILQLGHHGSSTSNSPVFLDAVNPEVAIYSAGSDNPYGHPHEEVVEAINERGIELYGTDVNGNILVTTTGKSYAVKTQKEGSVVPSNEGNSIEEDDNEQQSTAPDSEDYCIDINNASRQELQEIVNIGPERSKDLIDLRPFDSMNDLTKINGIGSGRINEIKEQGLACIKGG
ncbi:MBL fold metallo-hydrolase [Terrihalobacillus insolitus]|uniref:MBL fold metallo-hydrolase n=1 Tax=Terrihalobacillus insolitus TaxID=2950438 RepID=UPI0023402119|nr:MBL fold metallo-hydrolase [Terrihalobacillus insolitus]MDC3415000.1 MBL fold metallo-hydrolase [Terrihalobacillus insolitus]